MKIESVQYNDTHHTFAVSFSDGITVIVDSQLQYMNMLSTGLSSYYVMKNKWPAKKNLQRRVQSTIEWIERNKNRYKKWPDHKKTDKIKE